MFTDTQKDLALSLMKIGAIKFGAFRLKLHEKHPDAPLSPIYIDLRILRSYPKSMGLAINVYKGLLNKLQYDLFADVPTAATPIVAILSYELGIGMISPRKEVKKHGSKAKIDGFFKEKQKVLLIDDLITRADSKLETIRALEQNGLIVKDVVVLIDREQGGLEQLKKKGYILHRAITLSELLKFYFKRKNIKKEIYNRTLDYLKQHN